MAHTHMHTPSTNKVFVIGILLNAAYVVIEVLMGFSTGSLALLSDAGHNAIDTGSLLLSFVALKLAGSKSTKKYTYGYQKTTVLASLINGGMLLVVIGGIIWEAIHRFANPSPVPGNTIMLVAGIGIAINGITTYLFHQEQQNDLNIKGAYLHLLSDTLVSAGVVLSGLLISFTQWNWLDPAVSILIALSILKSTFSLFKESFRLSIDAVPESLNLDEIKAALKANPLVTDVHHIHLWAMSTQKNALTAHVVLPESVHLVEQETIKQKLKHKLLELGIEHATLEFEIEKEKCSTQKC